MIYVDSLKIPWRSILWCHMVSDQGADELKAFAKRIGLNPNHIQNEGTSRQHFDLCKRYHDAAISKGAIEVSTRELYLKAREGWNNERE